MKYHGITFVCHEDGLRVNIAMLNLKYLRLILVLELFPLLNSEAENSYELVKTELISELSDYSTYPSNPWGLMEKVADPSQLYKVYRKKQLLAKKVTNEFYLASTKMSDGKELEYFIWAPKTYQPIKPWPLIVILHGGGTGKSKAWAAMYISTFAEFYRDKPYVVISIPAPINKGWFRQPNVEAVFAAMKDTCQRFNINRRRMYLYGHSMGGSGVLDFAHAVPRLFAAFAPNTAVKRPSVSTPADMRGMAFILLNVRGGKRYLSNGAEVESYRFKTGHSIPHEMTHPLMFDFFDRHQNSVEPDLDKELKNFLEVLKKYQK